MTADGKGLTPPCFFLARRRWKVVRIDSLTFGDVILSMSLCSKNGDVDRCVPIYKIFTSKTVFDV